MACSEIRWAFNVFSWNPTKLQILKALSSISMEEVERIQGFRFKEDFKLSLAGRLLIRKCVEKMINIKWADIILARSEKGKPYLVNDIGKEKFYFNVSHQGDYVVLAASCHNNIGIDIMKHVLPNNSDIASFFKVMRRQFIDDEWAYIYSFSKAWDQLKAFYRLWCLKESYVKAVGVGIGTDSAAYMRFEINTNKIMLINKCCSDSVLYLRDKKQPWTFNECLIDDLHMVAVATENSNANHKMQIPFEYVDIDFLLNHENSVTSPEKTWWDNFQKKDTKM